ncbi:Alpha-L-fucosidase 1, partial [Cucurbita argyrosperma subsp. argyrosperma]
MKKKQAIRFFGYCNNIPKPSSALNSISQTQISIVFLLSLLLQPISSSSSSISSTPPLPILPIPSASQIQWQLGNMALFLHFGPNTFTDSEWGTGHVDPSAFNPTNLDAAQWVRVAKDAGFSRLILTAKHHDGFCLWPSEYTNYSVRSSPWRMAKEMWLGNWPRLQRSRTWIGTLSVAVGSSRALYGEIKEVWLDGAKGKDEKDMEYFFDSWFSLIHQLQPGAVIFSDAGPDCRWIGDEAGVAKPTCWSLFNCSAAKIGGTDSRYSGEGDPFGHDWVPAECDVSIRPGWFWHPLEVPKSARTLLDIYYKSAGRNCLLLLNVPPNSSGLISAEDIQVLQEFTKIRDSIFSHNLAEKALVDASSTRGNGEDDRFIPSNVLKEGIYTYWAPAQNHQPTWSLYLNLQEFISFNVLHIQEPIHMGQRIVEFHFDVLNDEGVWRTVVRGSTVGYRRILKFPTVESQFLRLVIEKSRADPLVSYLGIHVDNFSHLSSHLDKTLGAGINGSNIRRQITLNNSQISAV